MAPKLIQKFKQKSKAKDKIKVKVKDTEGIRVMEYLPISTAEDPLEFAINSILQAITIKHQYDLQEESKTKFLTQSIGQAFKRRTNNKFVEVRQGARFNSQNINTNKTHFDNMMWTFLTK